MQLLDGGFIPTLDSDDEGIIDAEEGLSDDAGHIESSKKKSSQMNPNFALEFGALGDDADIVEEMNGWDTNGPENGDNSRKGVALDEIIKRRKRAIESDIQSDDSESLEEDPDDDHLDGVPSDSYDSAVEENNDENERSPEEEFYDFVDEAEDNASVVNAGDKEEDSENGDSYEEQILKEDREERDIEMESESEFEDAEMPSVSSEDEEEADEEEEARKAEYFSAEKDLPKSSSKVLSFSEMNLSPPILRGLMKVGFNTPTPIQEKSIPIGLLGKDLVGGAVTGSGKTAAFIVPILERLLYRPKKIPMTRVIILCPTRELAIQCFNVATKIASFTDIKLCLCIGKVIVDIVKRF